MDKKEMEYGKLTEPISLYLPAIMDEIKKTAIKMDSSAWMEIFDYFSGKQGHLLRPVLILLSALSCSEGEVSQAQVEELTVFSACLEMTHMASLVHDDVIDLTDERRGQPAAQVVFGNSRAVLGGNLLYLLAFSRLADLQDDFFLDRMLKVSKSMCLGEIEQMYFADREISIQEYLSVITLKTASLMELACEGGARLAGAEKSVQEEYGRLGQLLGILYQLQDDFMDDDVFSIDKEIIKKEINIYLNMAKKMLEGVKDSCYKDSLQVFLRMVSFNNKL